MKSVNRALDLIELVIDRPLRIQQIADQLDVHKSSISRLVKSLEKRNYLKNVNGNIGPGYAILNLAYMIQESLDLRDVAIEYIEDLSAVANGTIHLAVLDDAEVVYIDKMDSPYPVRMHSRIGNRSPVYCTGVGKAMLANLPESEIHKILNLIQFQKFTETTITSKADLLLELNKIRKNGYSVDDREHEPEIHCIAAPIFNFEKRVIAAVSVSFTTSQRSKKEMLDLAPRVIETANSISRQLGYKLPELVK